MTAVTTPTVPCPIGILRGTGGVHWDASIAGHWRMNYTMAKLDFAIADVQRLEELGAFAFQLADGHGGARRI
ncbi:unnamed protein product [Aspergillus oryzae]|uniref:Unnamed protein product n=1 Tax=Aspergillus oryzae TaxID=5062 RepID=A0AAN4YUF4_ASPOZ|nr:unnamed protein product [Aspergillus oryzae]